jgi:hypothetical protein
VVRDDSASDGRVVGPLSRTTDRYAINLSARSRRFAEESTSSDPALTLDMDRESAVPFTSRLQRLYSIKIDQGRRPMNIKHSIVSILAAGAIIVTSLLLPSAAWAQDMQKVKAAMALLKSKAEKLGPVMSVRGQKHALPRRSIVVRFTSINGHSVIRR